MQILKGTSTAWCESSWISNSYMAQGVKSTTEPRGGKKCEDWKRTRMLFVTNSVQLVQRLPYQGSSGRVWRLQNMQANHSHYEICR